MSLWYAEEDDEYRNCNNNPSSFSYFVPFSYAFSIRVLLWSEKFVYLKWKFFLSKRVFLLFELFMEDKIGHLNNYFVEVNFPSFAIIFLIVHGGFLHLSKLYNNSIFSFRKKLRIKTCMFAMYEVLKKVYRRILFWQIAIVLHFPVDRKDVIFLPK